MTVYLNDRSWLGLKGCVETCECYEPFASVIVYAKPGLSESAGRIPGPKKVLRDVVGWFLVAEACGFRIAVACWLRGGREMLDGTGTGRYC